MSSNPFIDDDDELDVTSSNEEVVDSSGRSGIDNSVRSGSSSETGKSNIEPLVHVSEPAIGVSMPDVDFEEDSEEDYSDNWLLTGERDEDEEIEFSLPDIGVEQLYSGKPKRNVGMLAPTPLPDPDEIVFVDDNDVPSLDSGVSDDFESFNSAVHEGDLNNYNDDFIDEKIVKDSSSHSDEVEDDDAFIVDNDDFINGLDDGLDSVLDTVSSSFDGNNESSEKDDYFDYFENDEEEDILAGFDLDEIITKAIDMGASDIHINADRLTAFTILGEILYMEEFGRPNGSVLMRVQQDIISNVLESEFIQDLELDTSYVVKKGKHTGRRLRLSVGKSFGDIFFVMRVIADEVPSPQALGIDGTLLSWVQLPNGLVMVNGPTGTGKAVSKDTVVHTNSGKKKVCEIKVGDYLFDNNGKKTKVLDIHPSNDIEHFEITFNNGQKIKTAGNHLWRVESLNEWKNYGPWVRELLNKEDYEKAIIMLSNMNKDDSEMSGINEIKKLFPNSSSNLIQRSVNDNVEQINLSRVPTYTREFLLDCVAGKTVRHGQDLVDLINNDNTLFVDDKISYFNLVKLIGKKKANNIIDEKPHGFVQYNLYDVLEYLTMDSRRRFEQIEILARRGHSDRPELILSTKNMFEIGVKNSSGRTNWAVPYVTSPIEFEEKEHTIPAYVLGAWLGDGYSANGDIRGIDKEVLDKCIYSGEELLNQRIVENGKGQPITIWRFSGLKERLKFLGLISKVREESLKDIPDDYIYSSVAQRIELISGLMDTDGTVSKYGYSEIAMTNKNVVYKLREIICSLGWHANEIKVKKGTYSKDGVRVKCKDVYRFSFTPKEQIYNVIRKKQATAIYLEKEKQQGIRHERHYIQDIKLIKDDPENYVCFEVDSPDHLFLCTESFIPTHNSTTIASMIREIQRTRAQKIITLEKPIEFIYPDNGKALIVQREVGKDARSFARALDSAMRQAPDIIVVGEVRNRVEVNELLRAAETGHLAISTMHTVSPASTINRIMSLYEGDDQRRILSSLSDVARGFANQVLIKTSDGKRRIAVREILPVDLEVSKMIQAGDVRGIQEYQLDNGNTMEQQLVQVVKDKLCSVETARAQAADPLLFDRLLKGK